MSKQTEKQTKQVKNSKKDGKGFTSRVTNFFRELRGELKLVVWPDKQKMKQSAAIVFAIIIASALLIFAVDTIVNQSLTAAGFYDHKGAAAVQTPISSSASSQQTEGSGAASESQPSASQNTGTTTTGSKAD